MYTDYLLKLAGSTSEVLVAGPGSGVGHSAGAGSPFNDYIAGVAIYVLVVTVLVVGLLIGAFLVINLGLLSKRPQDRVGGRTPSDLGILKNNVWPEAPYEKNTLPAEEEDFVEPVEPKKVD